MWFAQVIPLNNKVIHIIFSIFVIPTKILRHKWKHQENWFVMSVCIYIAVFTLDNLFAETIFALQVHRTHCFLLFC